MVDGVVVDELPPFAEAVLEVVERIPPGHVLSYGDVAELIGSRAPRAVGMVMARHGAAVAWWRVVRANGEPAPGHQTRALARYREEGTPVRDGRVVMSRARWAPAR